MTLGHLAVIMLAGLAGCAAGEGPIRAAAAELSCPDAQITDTELYWGHHRVAGCGRENMYVINGDQWVSPLGRAAFELDCPLAKLRSTLISDRTVGVAGCGQKVVYVLANGAWVMNTESQPKGGEQN